MSRTSRVITGLALVAAMGFSLQVQAQSQVARAHQRQSALVRVGRLVGAPVISESFGRASARTDTAEVLGLVQNQDGVLVPNAGTVLLRDLNSGSVVATAPVNNLAQFTLRALPPGLYVSELVGNNGAIVASSPAFTAAAGDVIQIAHTVPASSLPPALEVLKSATALALGAAASGGVLAIGPGAPVTPGL